MYHGIPVVSAAQQFGQIQIILRFANGLHTSANIHGSMTSVVKPQIKYPNAWGWSESEAFIRMSLLQVIGDGRDGFIINPLKLVGGFNPSEKY